MTDSVVEVDLEEGSCSNPDCAYSDDGICVAKGEVNECEFFEPLTFGDDETGELELATIPLPSGEALKTDDLECVLAGRRSSTVVPLGLVKAGKTTLLCLIFDQIRTGRQLPWRFRRSRTTIGFARRSHDSSMRSGRSAGTARRTSQLESGRSLHIGCEDGHGQQHDLLLVDLSGEDVARFSDGKAADVVVAAVSRADHIPIVINGRLIANPDTRGGAIYEARAVLGMLERQELRDHVSTPVVITKGDLLVGIEIDALFDEITRGTIAADSPRIVTADRESMSSDNAGPEVERGLGLAELLDQITVLPVTSRGSWPSASGESRSLLLAKLWGRT